MSLSEIARETGPDRKTVRKYLSAPGPVPPPRRSANGRSLAREYDGSPVPLTVTVDTENAPEYARTFVDRLPQRCGYPHARRCPNICPRSSPASSARCGPRARDPVLLRGAAAADALGTGRTTLYRRMRSQPTVQRTEPAPVRQAAHRAPARGRRPGPQGPALEPAAGGPGPAGRRFLAHQPHPAPAGAAVRGVQVRGRPHHRPPRTRARPPAPQTVPQGHRPDRGRHPGPHPRPRHRRAVHEPPVLHHPPGRHRRRTRLVAVGRPLPGNRNDCTAWELSGAKDAVGRTTVIADGGYRGTGLLIPHRRAPGRSELPVRKEDHNRSHRKVRARVERTFARMKTWKILRDCRLKGDGVHHAMLGTARLHHLTLAGCPGNGAGQPACRRSFTGQRPDRIRPARLS